MAGGSKQLPGSAYHPTFRDGGCFLRRGPGTLDGFGDSPVIRWASEHHLPGHPRQLALLHLPDHGNLWCDRIPGKIRDRHLSNSAFALSESSMHGTPLVDHYFPIDSGSPSNDPTDFRKFG